jgi:hypothetical protein
MTGWWGRFCHWWQQDEVSYLYLCNVAAMREAAPAPYPGLHSYVCDAENLPLVQAVVAGLPLAFLARVAQGDLAIIAAAEGRWIFRSTAILGPQLFQMLGFPLVLTHEDAYLERAETLADWRGRGVAPGMLRITADALWARGIRNVYLTIATSNTASCKAIEKGGALRLGLIHSRRRCGRWSALLQRYTLLSAEEPLPSSTERTAA